MFAKRLYTEEPATLVDIACACGGNPMDGLHLFVEELDVYDNEMDTRRWPTPLYLIGQKMAE
jgi:hypothetical protein